MTSQATVPIPRILTPPLPPIGQVAQATSELAKLVPDKNSEYQNKDFSD